MPISFVSLCDELSISRFQLARLRDQRLSGDDYYSEEGRKFFTDAGADKLRLAMELPIAVPLRIKMRVIRRAPNPHWVYAKPLDEAPKGTGGVVPVAIRPRDCDRLIGKIIYADVIQDANGTTYRHEVLGYNS